MHFGIELNRIIEQAGDAMLPDTTSLLSEINWSEFIKFMANESAPIQRPVTRKAK